MFYDIKYEKLLDSEWLKNILPEPESQRIDGNRFGQKISITLDMLDRDDMERYVAYNWRKLYIDIWNHITTCTIGQSYWVTTKFYPEVLRGTYTLDLCLFVDIFVSPTNKVVVPEFIYSSWGHEPIEWRCGYCRSPNRVEERHCTQCGSPRALLIQEM